MAIRKRRSRKTNSKGSQKSKRVSKSKGRAMSARPGGKASVATKRRVTRAAKPSVKKGRTPVSRPPARPPVKPKKKP